MKKEPASIRILVVEDSPTQAEVLRAILATEVYQVEVARDGEEGLRRFEAGGIDLVLSDVVMPGMSGYDLCRRIKADPAGHEVPVIILTSLTDPMDIIQGLEAGADNFITKPYEAGYLVRRIAGILAAREAVRDGGGEDKVRMGASISFMGRSVTITSAKQQILSLLVTTFEEAVRKSRELEAKQKELEQTNVLLEEYARQAKGQARVSSEKYAILMEQASDGICLLDEQGFVVEANRQILALIGFSREDAIGRHFREFVPEADREQRAGDFQEVLAKGSVRLDAMHLLRADGRNAVVDLMATAVRLEGKVLILLIVRDAVERVATERRLELQRAVAEALAGADSFAEAAPRLLESVCIALGWQWSVGWFMDEARKGLRFQAAWAPPDIDMAPYLHDAEGVIHGPGQGLPGRAWESRQVVWIPDASRDAELTRTAPITRRVLDAGIRMSVAIPIICEGAVVAVIILGRREPGERDERLIRTFMILGDHIGQYIERKRGEERLRQSEEQFRQAQKMEVMGRLAGGVAHDFNNILTVISGYSEMLLSGMKAEDLAYRKVDIIRKAAEQAATLTHQLLAFSRRQVLQPRVLDLNETIGGMRTMLSRLIGEDVVFEALLGEGLGNVMADPGQIAQVIMNLAINARDAMPGGGKLTIETCNIELDEAYADSHVALVPGSYVCMAVSDTGCGMDAETRKRIFEPFFTTKEAGKGTGLGLSMVYGIVKQSGGNIWVYSEPGKGTTFKIYLPRISGKVELAGKQAVMAFDSRGTETILVVEDQSEVRELVCEILKSKGYRVLEASCGEEAQAVSGRHLDTVHLLATDLVMPGMGGKELVESLGGKRPAMKVLFMSGYTERATFQASILGKGESFIQKPFGPEALARKVRETLDNP